MLCMHARHALHAGFKMDLLLYTCNSIIEKQVVHPA